MGRRWRVPVKTIRCGCGTWPQGREKFTLPGHTEWVFSVAFSPDGTTLASSSWDGTVRLWNVTTGQEEATFTAHTYWVPSVAFSPDGSTLASGGSAILLWDMSPFFAPRPIAADFDGDGTVGFPDFLQFAAQFGTNQGDAGYDARFDLDGDAAVGFSDFVIFARNFGKGG